MKRVSAEGGHPKDLQAMAYRKTPVVKPQNEARPVEARPEAPLPVPTPPVPWSPPPGAISIWLGAYNTLHVGLGASRRDGLGHTVALRADDPALLGTMLLRVLRERAEAPYAKLDAGRGTPSQALVGAMEKALRQGMPIFREDLDPERLGDEDFLD